MDTLVIPGYDAGVGDSYFYDRQGNLLPDVHAMAALWEQRSYKFLADEQVGSDAYVATIWLGCDILCRSPAEGGLFFETTVFLRLDESDRRIGVVFNEERPNEHWGSDDRYEVERYNTEMQALAGHIRHVKRVRADQKQRS